MQTCHAEGLLDSFFVGLQRHDNVSQLKAPTSQEDTGWYSRFLHQLAETISPDNILVAF